MLPLTDKKSITYITLYSTVTTFFSNNAERHSDVNKMPLRTGLNKIKIICGDVLSLSYNEPYLQISKCRELVASFTRTSAFVLNRVLV